MAWTQGEWVKCGVDTRGVGKASVIEGREVSYCVLHVLPHMYVPLWILCPGGLSPVVLLSPPVQKGTAIQGDKTSATLSIG